MTFVIALAIAIPLILFPVALVWYLNIAGMVQAVRESHKKAATVKATR